jgi:hypothetical protein
MSAFVACVVQFTNVWPSLVSTVWTLPPGPVQAITVVVGVLGATSPPPEAQDAIIRTSSVRSSIRPRERFSSTVIHASLSTPSYCESMVGHAQRAAAGIIAGNRGSRV